MIMQGLNPGFEINFLNWKKADDEVVWFRGLGVGGSGMLHEDVFDEVAGGIRTLAAMIFGFRSNELWKDLGQDEAPAVEPRGRAVRVEAELQVIPFLILLISDICNLNNYVCVLGRFFGGAKADAILKHVQSFIEAIDRDTGHLLAVHHVSLEDVLVCKLNIGSFVDTILLVHDRTCRVYRAVLRRPK
jgi:hypothetical protein